MAGTAQSTVDSLLGRLSSALLEEAQLLRGVRGDVRFIKDEMEIMNGFLLDLANVENPNNQVQAWTRQVRDLATDSQNCIDSYVQSLGARPPAAGCLLGFLDFLRRVPHLARTMPTRHRIATQIRELKSRARELGERRLRYGIKAPPPDAKPPPAVVGDGAKEEEEEEERRALADVTGILEEDAREVIGWLTEELSDGDERHRPLRVIAITRTLHQEKQHSVALSVFDHPCMSSWFDFKAWIEFKGVQKTASRKEILQHVLKQLPRAAADTASGEEQQLVDHLSGHRILIVAANDPYGLVRNLLADAADGICSPGSALIVTAGGKWKPSEPSVPYKSKDYISPQLFRGNAHGLAGSVDQPKYILIRGIMRKCSRDFFCTEMFLRALYVNPNRTKVELSNLLNSLPVIGAQNRRKARKMVEFCYNGLPSHHKRCLLYLSIYPQGFGIRRTSLVRRWAAENFITKRDGMSEADESERCFKALVAWGLVRPVNIGAAGKVKSCKVHPHVLSFVARKAKDENASNTGLQPELAQRLLIHSRIELQKRSKEDANDAEPPNPRKNAPRRMQTLLKICECLKGSKAPSNSTEIHSVLLQASSLSGSVKVLDLEGFEGLNKSHLKYICNNISLLRYLSLRKTGVEELPKEIEKLRYLETLDIRETKVRAFATKSIVLQKLKHLLAGSINSPSEKFSTVLQMPRGIGHMTDLQILSHVKVSNSEEELMDVGELHQLRKLGVVLCGKEAHLNHLFQVITKLKKCLCSLSLSVQMVAEDATLHDFPEESATFSPPRSLVSLSISGKISGLPTWISELHRLSKITLRGTCLTGINALRILGSLANLHCLRLRDKSYMENTLTFKKEEFRSLKFLLVEGSEIHKIRFDGRAAPNLEKITWSSTKMKAPPSGVKNLLCLKEIELSNNWDQSRVRGLIRDISTHRNHPVVIHHPIREATAASSTSTPK